MLIGETHLRPNLHHLIPPWPPEPTSPSTPTTANYDTLLSSLRQSLFSYSPTSTAAFADDSGNLDYFPAEDDDEFFMYEFKVRNCTRPRAHDWTECPFAHPGEKARRRDPRKYNYSGNSCSDFRKGGCQKGDKCEFSHGVFESWLHPSKFRTQACKDGPGCTRRVCFFAHSPDQLRAGSALNLSPNPDSEPSLFDRRDQRVRGVGEVLKALSKMSLQLNKVKSLPKSWGSTVPHVGSGPIFGSPMMTRIGTGHTGRVGFFSLPTTPTQPIGAGRKFELWDNAKKEEEVAMERVESGRELRARMFDKLNKENSFNGSGFGSESNPVEGSGSGPDVGWISDLLTSLE